MSKRRDFGEVVLLDDDDDGPYLARILVPDTGRGHDGCMASCGDPDCREWWTLDVLDAARARTGEYAYHISECTMRDAPAKHTER